ncbi:MAG TPA: response regulator [Chitinophagales bacterium]|nr:response regulator [Chitinophagales bacterium]
MDITQIDVLLVEDNPHEAELTIRSLKKHNLANNLYHVEDGVEALDFIFAREKFNERAVGQGLKVILLDIKLPKVDGLEVLKQVKSDERTKSIPVVILTSSKEEQDIVASYKLGVNSYIVKPVQFDSFARAVADLGMYWMFLNQPNIKG